jgi:hypothetical protein
MCGENVLISASWILFRWFWRWEWSKWSRSSAWSLKVCWSGCHETLAPDFAARAASSASNADCDALAALFVEPCDPVVEDWRLSGHSTSGIPIFDNVDLMMSNDSRYWSSDSSYRSYTQMAHPDMQHSIVTISQTVYNLFMKMSHLLKMALWELLG